MRMRKKQWAEPFLQEHTEFVVQDPTQVKGKWKTLVHRDVLHVEIGSGKGDYWTKMARIDTASGWVGVEKNVSVAAVACKKAVNQGIEENMRFIAQDAANIDEWFDEKEIDVIHLNFSDPWPKKGNAKRRLSSGGFLTKYASILADDGCVIMKTDNRKLFEYSLVEFSQNGWLLDQVWIDFRSETHDEDAISEYEAKFMGLGQPIYRAIFKKGKKNEEN